MAIKAECPLCHRKQAVKNKVCACGQDMDKAKRGKKVKYHIVYRVNGKQKQEIVGHSIEDARNADAGRKTQKRENKLEQMLDIQAEGKITLSELAEWYVEIEQTRCKAKGIASFRRKQNCLDNFNAVYGDTIVRNITQADLENYKLARLTAGVTKRTVDYELGEVRRMMKTAWNNNKVSGRTWRIFDHTKKLLKAGENVRKRVLEPEAYVTLEPHLAKHHLPLCNLGLFTGMRPGELIPINKSNKEEATRGLTWDRVDFKNKMIVLEAEDTKTGEARKIPITDEILEILHSIPREIACNHVFTYRGVPLSNISGGIRRACKDAEIAFGMKAKGGFVFRDLRTTTDTLMARAGVADVYRRALLGHKQKGMDRHYVHPDFEKDLRGAMEKYTGWLKTELEAARQSVDQNVDQEGI
jgi:integrase